jgi:hypothetical protein
MTKTHKSDNELLASVKSSWRMLVTQHQGYKMNKGITYDQVQASSSLFELADSLHLGRTRTRAKLQEVLSGLISDLELAAKKEVV